VMISDRQVFQQDSVHKSENRGIRSNSESSEHTATAVNPKLLRIVLSANRTSSLRFWRNSSGDETIAGIDENRPHKFALFCKEKGAAFAGALQVQI
jgi:hypothetical protein